MRKPVYRGSAIFPVQCQSSLETRILFMGYWMVKNGLDELGLLVTLRDNLGKTVIRKSSQIKTASSQEIRIRNLLNEVQYHATDFIGSIELEVFSCRDLVFPYPAFVVNYYNEQGSSVVHTTGRIYNDLEDQLSNESKVIECGFDIFPGDDNDPFFSFVNGHVPSEDARLNIQLITSKGLVFNDSIDLGSLEALETRIVRLKEYLPVDRCLSGQVGTVKIDHNFSGFFPRFVAGNFSKSSNALSITHTYYDNSQNTSENAYWANDHQELMYDASIFVPLFLEEDFYTQLKLYPIYSPSRHKMSLKFLNEAGETLGFIEDFRSIDSDFAQFIEIDFKTLIQEQGLPEKEVKGVMLIKDWVNKSKIPTRLKYGLNVGKIGGLFNLPTNICFGSQISNAKLIQKKGTFKWFPLLNQGQSVAVIENSSFLKEYQKEANLTFTFYRSDENTITRNHRLVANGQMRLSVDEELRKFASEEPIWVTVKADNPFVKAWYFEFNSSGVMGGDHSF